MTKALMIHPVLAIAALLSAPWATASPDLDQQEACAATASPDPAAALLQVERQQLKVHMESNSSKGTANSSASESTRSSKRAAQNDAKQPMSSQLDDLERRVEALEGRRHDHGSHDHQRRGHSHYDGDYYGGHRPHWDGVAPRPDWNGLEDKPDPDDPKHRIIPGVRATREEGQGVVTGDKYKGDDPYEIMMDVDYIIDSNPKKPKKRGKGPPAKKGKASKGKGAPAKKGKGAPTNRDKKSSTRGKHGPKPSHRGHGPKPSSRGKTSDRSPKRGGKSFIEAPRSQSFIEEPKIW